MTLTLDGSGIAAKKLYNLPKYFALNERSITLFKGYGVKIKKGAGDTRTIHLYEIGGDYKTANPTEEWPIIIGRHLSEPYTYHPIARLKAPVSAFGAGFLPLAFTGGMEVRRRVIAYSAQRYLDTVSQEDMDFLQRVLKLVNQAL